MSILGFPKMNKKLNILFKNHRRILCFFYIILVSFAFAYKYSNCVYSVAFSGGGAINKLFLIPEELYIDKLKTFDYTTS